MSDKIKKLRDDRAKIVHDQRTLLEKAESEKRDLTAEEETNYEAMDTDFNKLTDEIKAVQEAEQRKDERAKTLKAHEDLLKRSQKEPVKPDVDTRVQDDKKVVEYPIEQRYKNAVAAYREHTDSVYSLNTYDKAFRAFLANGMRGLNTQEERALQADNDGTGGFLVAPEQFVMQLIQKVDNMVFVRRYANVISIPNAASLGAPALDNDPADPTWTAEIKTGTEDSTMDFDKRALHPHPLAKRIKVSKKLIRVAAMNIDSTVRDRLAYKFGVTEENAFLNGDGSNAPLGVFTASANGINTGRDISTGNTATGIKADNLIDCKYKLKAQYRNSSSTRWAFHRDAIKMIRKLKDGEGNYLWKQGLSDRPDTILDIPFEESEYCPKTYTTGLYVGILGDWRFYWIADALDMVIQVLTELYAETNQNGYIGRKETDGMPVLEEAFVRVKLA